MTNKNMSTNESLIENVEVLLALILGTFLIIMFYVMKWSNKTHEKQQTKNKMQEVKQQQHTVKKDTVSATAKSKKKTSEGRWTGRSEKNTYSHSWCLTSLKGHTGQILDVDISNNEKYLASCADELGESTSTSSGSEFSKENSPCPSPHAPAKTLSRRQRKNRKREEKPPPSEPIDLKEKSASKRTNMSSYSFGTAPPRLLSPLRFHTKLNMKELNLYKSLSEFVVSDPTTLLNYGYPIEINNYPGSAMVFTMCFKLLKSLPTLNHYGRSKLKLVSNKSLLNRRMCDNIVLLCKSENGLIQPSIMLPASLLSSCATSAVPNQCISALYPCEFTVKDSVDVSTGIDYNDIKAEWKANHDDELSADSGQGSGNSSPASEEDYHLKDIDNKTVEHIGEELKCVRCDRGFFVTSTGDYLTEEKCFYHWGKVRAAKYTCCFSSSTSKGCTINNVHVWKGTESGFNGPLEGYVKTKSRFPHQIEEDCDERIFALDTEMCYTSNGLDATKITIVATDGRIVYDYMIKPTTKIVDYNTKFSGVTSGDFKRKHRVKTLQEVQEDLLSFIFADTILVGHGLENDLRALRIIHYRIIDTSLLFPDARGFPYRMSLKSLIALHLKRKIQTSANGHDCLEDARASMELVLYKLYKQFERPVLINNQFMTFSVMTSPLCYLNSSQIVRF